MLIVLYASKKLDSEDYSRLHKCRRFHVSDVETSTLRIALTGIHDNTAAGPLPVQPGRPR
jgi:hypothetical protein